MMTRTNISNFGPIVQICWQNLGPINLVIGRNGSGKTFLLKALYSALRTHQDARLVPVQEALVKSMQGLVKARNLPPTSVAVLNEEGAKQKGLISEANTQ